MRGNKVKIICKCMGRKNIKVISIYSNNFEYIFEYILVYRGLKTFGNHQGIEQCDVGRHFIQ